MRINETPEDDLRRSTLGDDLFRKLTSYLYALDDKTPGSRSYMIYRGKMIPAYYVYPENLMGRGFYNDVIIAFYEIGETPAGIAQSIKSEDILSGNTARQYVLAIGLWNFNKTTGREIYYQITNSETSDVFRHEVQHIIDLKRHGNKDNIGSVVGDDKIKYFNDPLERNAFTHNICEPLLTRLRWIERHGVDTIGLFNQLPTDFRQFMQERASQLYGSKKRFWEHLTPENKQKLISRMAKLFDLYWRTHNNEIKKIAQKWKEEDAEENQPSINTSDA